MHSPAHTLGTRQIQRPNPLLYLPMRRIIHLVSLSWVLSGCRDLEADRPEIAVTDTISVDRQRCLLPAGVAPSDSAAVRCAELFVQRNGYTDLPPVPDSTQWTGEFMDVGILGRHNMLQRRAHSICRGTIDGDSVVSVIFEYGPMYEQTDGGHGRGIMATADLSYIRIKHQDFVLPSVSTSWPSCEILP